MRRGLEPFLRAQRTALDHFSGCHFANYSRSWIDRISSSDQYKTEVYDADLEGYFDSIPHDKLMKCIRMRVVDGAVLGLIKQWLEAPVVEAIREEGKRERKPRHKVTRNSKGTPQRGVASPLLANIYLHWFDRVFHSEQGPAKWAKATLIRYADDFVILGREITPRLESFVSEKIEQCLGLKINRDKTRIYEVTPQALRRRSYGAAGCLRRQ